MRKVNIYTFKEKRPELNRQIAILMKDQICIGVLNDDLETFKRWYDEETDPEEKSHLMDNIRRIENSDDRYVIEWISPSNEDTPIQKMLNHEWCYLCKES